MSDAVLAAPPRTRGVSGEPSGRLLDATLTLVERRGIAGTTMADIAREAGCSRATAYRVFGSKTEVVVAAAGREVARFEEVLAERVAAADTLEHTLVAGIVESHRFLAEHRALQYVLAHEPGSVLPFLGFGQIDTLYAEVRRFGAPHLTRFLEPHRAGWTAEWVARLVLSHVFQPGDVPLADASCARALVRRFLLPSLPAQPHPLNPSGDPS